MNKEITSRVTQMTVLPKDDPIFSEFAITVSIDDEAAGEFVVIESKSGHVESGKVFIDVEEWPVLRETIDKMISECRDHD